MGWFMANEDGFRFAFEDPRILFFSLVNHCYRKNECEFEGLVGISPVVLRKEGDGYIVGLFYSIRFIFQFFMEDSKMQKATKYANGDPETATKEALTASCFCATS